MKRDLRFVAFVLGLFFTVILSALSPLEDEGSAEEPPPGFAHKVASRGDF